MKKILGSFFMALVFGGLAFLVTESLMIAVGVLLLFAFTFFLVIFPQISRAQAKIRKRHEGYRFVHSFIITLSVSHSGHEAYQSASLGTAGEEKEIMGGLGSFSLEEKLDYLTTYFEDDFYKMFVSIFRLYEDQGGDVLKMAEPLLMETTLIEESGNEKDKIQLLCFSQFASLWAMSLLILAFLRFGLSNFYGKLTASPIFLGVAVLYFIFALASFGLYAYEATGEKIVLGRGLNHVRPQKKTPRD
jgi:hypothetical protein